MKARGPPVNDRKRINGGEPTEVDRERMNQPRKESNKNPIERENEKSQ